MGYIFIVGGLALAALGIVLFRRGAALHARASASWRQADGTLDQGWVSQHRSDVRGADGGSTETIGYRPNVAYRYTVDGSERIGNRPFLCARRDFNSAKAAQRWLDTIGAQRPLPVWYDPAASDISALELNRPSRTLILVMGPVGVMVAALGLALALRGH